MLFITFLAAALRPVQATIVPPHISDHTYAMTNSVMNSQQYTDDTHWIKLNKQRKEELKVVVPSILKCKDVQINESKTEEYEIKRGGEENWKKCKYLGSLLDTQEDIKRRKVLATDSYYQLKHIFESKAASLDIKIRIFKSHIESIFMYSCELWTVTKKLVNIIDA